MTVAIGAAVILAVATAWIGWRLLSRRSVLPCPAMIAALVDIENPLARATRSQAIVERLAPRPGDRIADIGCGPGRVTVPLARQVCPRGEVAAIDLQPGMLARVRAKAAREGLANIRLVQADIRDGLLTAEPFDAAVVVMALGEIPGASVFPGLLAALKPGGRVVIAESVFDPHYVAIRRVRDLAAKAGFEDRGCVGNVFGYNLLLVRPVAD